MLYMSVLRSIKCLYILSDLIRYLILRRIPSIKRGGWRGGTTYYRTARHVEGPFPLTLSNPLWWAISTDISSF